MTDPSENFVAISASDISSNAHIPSFTNNSLCGTQSKALWKSM